MALAEPRRRQKWTLNPRGNLWANDEDKFGAKLMKKMGWESGKGLGAKQDGILDPIRIRQKADIKGVGFEGHDDTWLAHQDDFQDVLAALNSEYGNKEETETLEVESQNKSLEATSKSSLKRVHYQKFTRGKDLANYSAEDLGCILGTKSEKRKKRKRKVSETEVQDEGMEVGSVEKSHGVVAIQGGSYQEYFAKKMATLRANGKFTSFAVTSYESTSTEEGVQTVGFNAHQEGTEGDEDKTSEIEIKPEVDSAIPDAEFTEDVTEKRKKKKKSSRNETAEADEELRKENKEKKKKNKDQEEVEEAVENLSDSQNKKIENETNLKQDEDNNCELEKEENKLKKKDRKRKRKEENEENDNIVEVPLADDPPKKKKKRAGEDTEEKDENDVSAETTKKEKRKKKKAETEEKETNEDAEMTEELTKKEKKKKKKAEIEEKEIDEETEVTEEVTKKEKKKKKKAESEEIEENKTNEVAAVSEELTKKEKRKKKKKVETEELEAQETTEDALMIQDLAKKEKKVEENAAVKNIGNKGEKKSLGFIGSNLLAIAGYGSLNLQ